MKTLYTAFKGKNNTSYQLVSRIDNNSLFLTNSFTGLEKDILRIECDFDNVYMFGVDKNLNNKIKIEVCAEYNGKFINTGFDIATLVDRLDIHSISHTVSKSPTKYLCNAAYYHMLKKNPNTIFIHIPSLKGMNDTLMNKLAELF